MSSEVINFPKDKHLYKNHAEFAHSNCIPCHYHNVNNGTDLSIIFAHLSEQGLKTFLLPILKDGQMPPDKALREILYYKLLSVKSQKIQ